MWIQIYQKKLQSCRNVIITDGAPINLGMLLKLKAECNSYIFWSASFMKAICKSWEFGFDIWISFPIFCILNSYKTVRVSKFDSKYEQQGSPSCRNMNKIIWRILKMMIKMIILITAIILMVYLTTVLIGWVFCHRGPFEPFWSFFLTLCLLDLMNIPIPSSYVSGHDY